MIKAKFIGQTSCGFISNHVYQIKIFTDKNSQYIWVKDKNSRAKCPYSSIKTLSQNWEIPTKDEFSKIEIPINELPVSNSYWRYH